MEQSGFALSDDAFVRVRQRAHALAGIALSEPRRALVISRLTKLVKALGLTSFDAYLDHLDAGRCPAGNQDFVNALTTNLTRFYREEHHFTHLRAHVAALLENQEAGGRRRLRIWSAGCSTGQEPYTVAMDLLSALPELQRRDFRILATDIDTEVLARAAMGSYAESEVSGLPPERLHLFERTSGGRYRVPAAARAAVIFKPLNLLGDWPMKGRFDAIFCRNVAIYFDRPTQARLFSRLGEVLAPGGMLYIGHSENLGPSGDGFRLAGTTTYVRSTPGKREAA